MEDRARWCWEDMQGGAGGERKRKVEGMANNWECLEFKRFYAIPMSVSPRRILIKIFLISIHGLFSHESLALGRIETAAVSATAMIVSAASLF